MEIGVSLIMRLPEMGECVKNKRCNSSISRAEMGGVPKYCIL